MVEKIKEINDPVSAQTGQDLPVIVVLQELDKPLSSLGWGFDSEMLQGINPVNPNVTSAATGGLSFRLAYGNRRADY